VKHAKATRAPSPLAELNAHIEQVTGVTARGSTPWPDLRSARRFRETWERLGAEGQVQRARERAPQNAGPLNPQRLMLEALARMGELSPHYLRRFLAHTETLLWLEQAQAALRRPASGAARTTRPVRTRR
jgi:hypothetical protein